MKLALAVLLLAAPAFASHEDFGVGARSAGMGDAMTAAGDDPGSVVYNPALGSAVAEQEIQLGARRASLSPSGPMLYDQVEAAAAAPVNFFPWRGAVALHGYATRIESMPGGVLSDPALNPTADPTFDPGRPGLRQRCPPRNQTAHRGMRLHRSGADWEPAVRSGVASAMGHRDSHCRQL